MGTPAQDYDDAYCIRYAQTYGGVVVTNDQYRDHVAAFPGRTPEERAERDRQRAWTKSRLVSFTFVADEFLPNPLSRA